MSTFDPGIEPLLLPGALIDKKRWLRCVLPTCSFNNLQHVSSDRQNLLDLGISGIPRVVMHNGKC